MPLSVVSPARVHFLNEDAAQFDQIVSEWGWPRFRGRQVRDWVYDKQVAEPACMTNLSPGDRRLLADKVDFLTSSLATSQLSADGTQKLLLTWPDAGSAETVMIPDADRRTACVSSQIGCPVGCKFCASGLDGLKGNLSAGQIVEQIYRLNTSLHPRGERITNIVFMGMGEPLANYHNVIRAVRILHDADCFNIGARRITISTVGVPPRIRELANEALPLNLAISLHAPNEPLRKQLIPWAEHFGLSDILEAARYYFTKTGREVTLEYILLAGVNDQPQHARELCRLCHTLRVNVNLIRYNPVEGLPFGRPRSEDVVRFQEILREDGVNAHVRKSRGRDIDAACGQLRRKSLESSQLVTVAPG